MLSHGQPIDPLTTCRLESLHPYPMGCVLGILKILQSFGIKDSAESDPTCPMQFMFRHERLADFLSSCQQSIVTENVLNLLIVGHQPQ